MTVSAAQAQPNFGIPKDPTDRRLLTVIKTGTGTGTVSGPGISCGTDCGELHIVGTTTILTATAAGSAVFTGWSGACTGTGSCTVTMSQARSVTANFDVFFNLTVTKAGTGTGTVTSAPSGISCGSTCVASFVSDTTVILSASAGSGSTFSGWSGACSGTGTCTVGMSANRSVTATFIPTTFTLTVTKSGTGAGTVSSTPAGISCGGTCAAAFIADSTVALSQTPAAGSTFIGWSGSCSGTGACSVLMSQARSVTATYTFPGWSLAWDHDGINLLSFSLERRTPCTTGTYGVIATPAASPMTYTDTTALPTAQYQYRISAVGSGGASSPSNEVCTP